MLDSDLIACLEAAWQNKRELFTASRTQLMRSFTDFDPEYPELTFPPPVFTATATAELAGAAEKLIQLIYSIPERVFGGDYALALSELGFSAIEIDYLLPMCIPTLMRQAKLLARPDFFVADSGFKLMETNVAAPIGGVGTVDRYIDEFVRTPLALWLRQRGHTFVTQDTALAWAHTYRDEFNHSYQPSHDSGPIFLVELLKDSQPDSCDFVAKEVKHWWGVNGIEATNAPLADIRFASDGLYLQDRRIDIISAGFLYSEAVEDNILNEWRRVVEAAEAGQIVFFGTPVTAIYDNKMNLAVLSDEAFRHCFDSAELALIERYIPRTRKLDAASATEARADRHRLVLKEALGFGGTGVTIGRNESDAAWEQVIEVALRSGRPHVLQQIVEDPLRHPVVSDGRLQLCHLTVGAFLFQGIFSGGVTRSIPACGDKIKVINVKQGATFAPMLTAAAVLS